MRHEYVIDYEIWASGVLAGFGNQTIGLTAEGPPAANEFLKAVREDIMQRAGCTAGVVRVVGVFKL